MSGLLKELVAPVFDGIPACRDQQELMFDPSRKEVSREVCLGCPVFLACADWAHPLHEELMGMVAGVWRDMGGMANDTEIDLRTAGLKPRMEKAGYMGRRKRLRMVALEDARIEAEKERNRGGRPRVLPDSRVCLWCEQPFVPGRIEQKCCSRRCSARRREAGRRSAGV